MVKMKILGHAYVATHTVGENKELLIVGSLVPEMLPYIPNKIFEYNELHEGGKKLFRYLNCFHPNKIEIALGLLSHGVELGADKFSPASEDLVACQKKSLLEKISRAQGVNLRIAKGRLHNYVGLGLDWLLFQNKLDRTFSTTGILPYLFKKCRLNSLYFKLVLKFI